jgi:lipopolysaccharide transport system ATP-binding protein
MKPAIEVEHLSKRFRLGLRRGIGHRTLRESIMDGLRAPLDRLRPSASPTASGQNDRGDFWALRDVSFAIRPGEVIGLIGRNGAGKSSLLKVLSRITEPTAGRAVVRGRMGSLLEVGTGFHNELTGRENIYLNGSILGMTRREITRKFDEIVAFAEMDRFLDTPVKRYSSGMYVRLAFAIAAHLDLDILLVDEVLAVGDLDFQKKCIAKMGTIAQGGRTVVFVSHSLGLINRLCDRGIVLRDGRVQYDGPAAEAIQSYMQDGAAQGGQWTRPADARVMKDVVLRRVQILGGDGRVTGVVNCEDPFRVGIEYEVIHPTPNFEVSFTVRNREGVAVVSSMDSDTYEWPTRIRPPGRYRATCMIPGHLLAPGGYTLSLSLLVINLLTHEDHQDILGFEVSEMGCIKNKRNDRRGGVITPILDWSASKIG